MIKISEKVLQPLAFLNFHYPKNEQNQKLFFA